jgi:phosphopantothenoylcysteine decarboxylase/phosphopantothenate--cysteine ligase
MGYALARAAFRRGAHVTLVSGPTTLPCPAGVNRLQVQTADQMYDTVISHARKNSIIIKAAAVADYKPVKNHEHKVKKDQIKSHLELELNKDILLALGEMKNPGQILVGFAAESQNFRDEGVRKLKKKNLDIIAVNDISTQSTGFEVENNQVLLITKNGEEQLPFTSKLHTANLMWDTITQLIPA